MKGKFEHLQLPNHIQFETVSQATKLLEKRRILYEVHEALDQQKEEFNRQKEGLQRHEEIIREADINIQEHLIKYGQSLIETDKKTKQTSDRLEADRQDLDKIKAEIAKEKESIAELQKERDILEVKQRSLKMYETLVLHIIEKKDLFPATKEMISRHKTLQDSNKRLEKEITELSNSVSNLKTQRAEFKKNSEDKKLQLNNEISNLQKYLDDLEVKKASTQATIDSSNVTVHRQMMELAKLLMAIDDLYDKCLKQTYITLSDNTEEENKKKKQAKAKEKEGGETENLDTYKHKSEIATAKLKKIHLYAEGLKQIIKHFPRADVSSMNTRN